MHTYIVLSTNDESSLAALSAFGAELIASKEAEFVVWLWRDVSDTALATIKTAAGYLGSIEL
jgi:hypothetical protein